MTTTRPDNPDPSTLWHALNAPQRALLRRIAACAEEESSEAFLAGGPVRDLLRGDAVLHDLDIVTTADARHVAQRFAATASAALAKTTQFGTATVRVPHDEGGITAVDFATARTETYPRPGALPVVTFPAPVHDDLHRRDVTINAMALPITPNGFGALLDPTGGLTDLRTGIIRVLHDASFREDPTRLYRAARYAARFGFRVEPRTATLLHTAIAGGALATLSPNRKRNELERGLREANPVACFDAFDVWGVLRATSPALIWDEWVATRMPLVASTAWPVWAFFLSRQDDAAGERLFTDLAIGAVQQPIRTLVRVWREREAIARVTRLSLLRPLLEKLRGRDVLALLCDDPAYENAAAFYHRLHHLQHQDARWSQSFGDYLKELGVTPGPVYGGVLGSLRDARLNGEVETRDEAYAFIRRHLTALAPAR